MLWIGVDLFFVLSGFLITGILLDLRQKDPTHFFARFYQRRARRILPPYLLVLALVSLRFGAPWARHWYMMLGAMNYIRAFHEPWFLPLVPLWSLGVEEQFYLLWPLVIYFVDRRRLPAIACALIVAAPILRGIASPWNTWHWFIYMGTPFRMDTLATGCLLAFAWRTPRLRQAIRRFGFLGLIPLALIAPVMLALNRLGGFSTMDGTRRADIFTYELALLAVTGTFLWALGGRFTAILRAAPLRWMGRISFSFYLIHSPILFVLLDHFDMPRPIQILTFVLSTLYATLSWFLVERPILAGGPGRTLEHAAARP